MGMRGPTTAGEEAREPGQAPRSGGGWRGQVNIWSGMNVFAGLWLVVSPGFIDFDANDWNPQAFGAIVTVIALLRISLAARHSWLSVVNAAIGVWLFVSAFLLHEGAGLWNNIILGVTVFIFALYSAGSSAGGTERIGTMEGGSRERGI